MIMPLILFAKICTYFQWMALCRDVPFLQSGNQGNRMLFFRSDTRKTLFFAINIVYTEMTLETERLTFRRWQDADADILFEYASDPELGPRAGWPPHQSVEESHTIIRDVFGGDTMWAIVLKETSKIVGCIGYLPHGMSNIPIGEAEAEVGYWIARPYWNQDICTEALRWLIGYCFNTMHFTALWGDFFVDNPASGRVMEKCGFIDTGQETTCPNLLSGKDRKVRVKKLER